VEAGKPMPEIKEWDAQMRSWFFAQREDRFGGDRKKIKLTVDGVPLRATVAHMRISLTLLLAIALPLQAAAQDDLRTVQEKAARGDPAAQSSLGWRYHLGQELPKDDQKALELLRSSVAKGNAAGMTNLADFYYEGILVPRDLAKAADLNEQAAATKCGGTGEQSCRAVLRAKVNLALMLTVGDGRPKNLRRAVQLFKDAIANGYDGIDAKLALAGMAIKGEGMQPDSLLSLRLFKEVASTGNVDAAQSLGTIYYRGLAGVPVDLREAKRWYTLAAPKDASSRAALLEIEAIEADPLAVGARSQRQLLRSQGDEKAFQDTIAATQRRLGEITNEHLRRLYFAAKSAGIRMTPVAAALGPVNAGRRTTGVWELIVDEQIDGPFLVAVLDFSDRELMFAVEGKGTYTASGYLRDPQFRNTGHFAADCKFQVYLGKNSKLYPCSSYFNGELNDQVDRDLREMLATDIKG
jgi:uncharacterized protein